ncbi:lantibiotic modifying enzyme [Thermocatellispora tengchongensis]|uniref:Lantibiotic modifying enzyme n=1 Tax=Thermocatellispora tengchongensis TaxID=1073253 RepID=A0A840P6T4_9ACTN|nr:lanthionine synthetase LanC family protein [Thermocatellispora tengchongensis]MBB5134296.1 lantibiotic modifying enzyme [Thermocatellispora tengchongensis]
MDRERPSWPHAETPLEAAVLAARWIRGAAVDDELGRWWRPNPDAQGRSALPDASASIYAGAAGIVLFFIELATATGDESYLADAAAGARRLAATVAGGGGDPTLYHGTAGVMFALAEAGWATGEAAFEDAARTAADRLVRRLRGFGGSGHAALRTRGVGWTSDPALRGDGGIVLALLHASGMLGVPEYERVAVEAGERIAELVVPGHRFGEEGCADLPLDAVTPGFLSGTAGTAFVLARLYGVTRERAFLEAARRGADFVRTVSVVSGRCALVPHHVPQGRALHYLGFCSGSAGVARLFYELHRIGEEPARAAAADLEWVERLALGIMQSGVPHRQTEGFWNVACQCCGTAGLVELFVGMWSATGRDVYLDFARVLAENLIGRATGGDGAGYRWYQAYRRLRPWEVTADTGYMVGAAGIASALLHLHAAEHPEQAGRQVLLPDNPFPAIPLPTPSLN